MTPSARPLRFALLLVAVASSVVGLVAPARRVAAESIWSDPAAAPRGATVHLRGDRQIGSWSNGQTSGIDIVFTIPSDARLGNHRFVAEWRPT